MNESVLWKPVILINWYQKFVINYIISNYSILFIANDTERGNKQLKSILHDKV